MKLELTRAEVEKILLEYANNLVQGQKFNNVKGGPYMDLPDTVTLTKTEKE